jgi:hypothetical protein
MAVNMIAQADKPGFFDKTARNDSPVAIYTHGFFLEAPVGKFCVVRPGEPEPGRPSTVSQAAKDGSRRDLLIALRVRIAQAVESRDTPAPALAALSRRLLEVARELETLGAEGVRDDVSKAAATPDEEWASPRDGDVGSGADDPPE